jgi:hypothetical protein
LMCFHVNDAWCVRRFLATAARVRRRAQMIPDRGKERPGGLKFKREYSRASADAGAARSVYS